MNDWLRWADLEDCESVGEIYDEDREVLADSHYAEHIPEVVAVDSVTWDAATNRCIHRREWSLDPTEVTDRLADLFVED